MKDKSKRLPVLMVIALLTLVLPLALAAAEDHWGKKIIEGEYAFTGAGNCFVSPTGFGDNYAPNDPTLAFVTPAQIWEGHYTFKRDGTGSVTSVTRQLDLPGALNIANISWAFNYTTKDNTTFTTKVTPGTFDTVEWIGGPNVSLGTNYFEIDGPCDGVLSQDGKTLTSTCGPPTILTLFVSTPSGLERTPFQAYCSFSHVGVRVDK